MTIADELRTLAAEISLRHLEGQLGQPWALTEGADYIDALKAHNAAHAITIADQAYRIDALEAHEQIETRVTHLWPGYHTHPPFREGPPWWGPCPEEGLDCSRWEHRTETRTARKSSPWVPAEDGAS